MYSEDSAIIKRIKKETKSFDWTNLNHDMLDAAVTQPLSEFEKRFLKTLDKKCVENLKLKPDWFLTGRLVFRDVISKFLLGQYLVIQEDETLSHLKKTVTTHSFHLTSVGKEQVATVSNTLTLDPDFEKEVMEILVSGGFREAREKIHHYVIAMSAMPPTNRVKLWGMDSPVADKAASSTKLTPIQKACIFYFKEMGMSYSSCKDFFEYYGETLEVIEDFENYVHEPWSENKKLPKGKHWSPYRNIETKSEYQIEQENRQKKAKEIVSDFKVEKIQQVSEIKLRKIEKKFLAYLAGRVTKSPHIWAGWFDLYAINYSETVSKFISGGFLEFGFDVKKMRKADLEHILMYLGYNAIGRINALRVRVESIPLEELKTVPNVSTVFKLTEKGEKEKDDEFPSKSSELLEIIDLEEEKVIINLLVKGKITEAYDLFNKIVKDVLTLELRGYSGVNPHPEMIPNIKTLSPRTLACLIYCQWAYVPHCDRIFQRYAIKHKKKEWDDLYALVNKFEGQCKRKATLLKNQLEKTI